MEWTEKKKNKLKRKNQILFSKDSECFSELKFLIEQQNHRAMALWALELSEEAVRVLEEKYPDETRPREALNASKLWAFGEIRMREAQRKILDCHGFAKEIDSLEDIALCHAVGQGCAVVHTAGHAMGFPMYELTAIVRKYGIETAKEAVENRIMYYVERLIYWSQQEPSYKGKWADFMLK